MSTLTSKTKNAGFDAMHWWIDAVGGYLTFAKSTIRIGHAGDERNDIPILADISGFHAELRRGKSGIVLAAMADTEVNGKTGEAFLLRHGDKIRLKGVELTYHQPVPWSLTARLELTSAHRLPLALDGIVLLGETCILGPRRDAHIHADWKSSVFVNWYQGRYWVRGPGKITIDGRTFDGWGPVEPTSRVQGAWGAFRWEPA
jgi:hypothetical protein